MPEELPNLLPMSVMRDRWEVVQKLGEGGFGSVYTVRDRLNQFPEGAMKTELSSARSAVLKFEAFVLQRLQGKTHFLKYYDMNTQENVRYLVMQLAGRNLTDLRRAVPLQKFKTNTTIRLVIQCVEATRDIHSIGFLHRDIKPSNFAMGRDPRDYRTLYMLDFGLARCYTTKTGELRQPRIKCGFRGTIRYASPNAHAGKELGRHDDLYSTLYMAVELRNGRLPWYNLNNKEEVGKMKMTIPQSQLLKDMPSEFLEWHNVLCKLRYFDTPDYDWIIEKMRQLMRAKGYQEDSPYDWEEGGDSYMHTMATSPLNNPYESQIKEQKEVIRTSQ
ncbi:Pkinase domain containing protein [Trichuris trichiura]|uniref:Pkinase domain containing protein n=1 Tax=Trichuris trichiura TaxID=36087 RepID=A0A077ZJQ1_TRITR|nr:Pkinase domain containing protein [Trichuris trichiura]